MWFAPSQHVPSQAGWLTDPGQLSGVYPAILDGGEHPKLELLVLCIEIAVAEKDDWGDELLFPALS